MSKKKTLEEFKNEVYEQVKDEYSVLGTEYIGTNTKILMKHNKCGYEYMIKPNGFLSQKRRCPKCSGLMKKTTDEFKNDVFNLVKDEYSVLGDYINNKIKIPMKHNICNNEFLMRPNEFLGGNRCPHCKFLKVSTNMTKTHKKFEDEVYQLVQNEYSILDEYKNSDTKILMKHNKCGYEYLVTPHTFLNGNRCPKCFGVIKKDTNYFKNEVYEQVKDEYSVLGEYKNNHTKILMKHNKCGYEYEVTPNGFLSAKHRCPYCRVSKGEEKISKYLDKLKINYKEQVSFPDCKYKFPLRFDFQIITNNDNIILLEYDGEQHFKPMFYSSYNFETQQLRDKIKDEYCNNNPNIHLYRIKYTEFDNIEGIINNIIKIEGSTTIERIA